MIFATFYMPYRTPGSCRYHQARLTPWMTHLISTSFSPLFMQLLFQLTKTSGYQFLQILNIQFFFFFFWGGGCFLICPANPLPHLSLPHLSDMKCMQARCPHLHIFGLKTQHGDIWPASFYEIEMANSKKSSCFALWSSIVPAPG